MQLLKIFLFISIILSLLSHNVATYCKSNPRDPCKTFKTITVDASGKGNFSKVQDAINSVPSNNADWIRIYVSVGEYLEKVNISSGKECIFLDGAGVSKTSIKWNDSESTSTSYTFSINTNNILVKGIRFENTFQPQNGERVRPAVAAMLYGNNVAFYDCAFVGYQDSLGDLSGRHYFKNCYIEGAVDFVFGYGQSIYEDCDLVVRTDKVPGRAFGYITAHGRPNQDDEGGFVFIRGNISGVGQAYLGRGWTQYARVIFSKTNMSDLVLPEGWVPWHGAGNESDLTFVEENCVGPGANTSGRVDWLKRLDDHQRQKYLNLSYVNQDDWIGQLPNTACQI